jgi:hypothetical protein
MTQMKIHSMLYAADAETWISADTLKETKPPTILSSGGDLKICERLIVNYAILSATDFAP